MTTAQTEILNALTAQGLEVLSGKGGFFVRGEGWISLAAARKRTGIATPKTTRRARVTPYGDYAWVAAINRQK
jgi:hypothetical protein